jgi:RHS repeat-associated protein
MNANAYSPYGCHLSHLGAFGFNGERPDLATGHYHLGNGYRAYNPVVMRFNAPDSLSPFAQGGLNAYGYCQGDPVNFRDPSGHWLVKALAGMFNRVPTNVKAMAAVAAPKSFTRLIGFHGTKALNGPSLKSGLSRGHSQADRRLQGEGFYITDDLYQAKGYAKKAGGPGAVFGVFLEDDLSLVPTIGYGKDKAGRIVLRPSVFPNIQVRDLPPPDVKVVEIREAPDALKKPDPTL